MPGLLVDGGVDEGISVTPSPVRPNEDDDVPGDDDVPADDDVLGDDDAPQDDDVPPVTNPPPVDPPPPPVNPPPQVEPEPAVQPEPGVEPEPTVEPEPPTNPTTGPTTTPPTTPTTTPPTNPTTPPPTTPTTTPPTNPTTPPPNGGSGGAPTVPPPMGGGPTIPPVDPEPEPEPPVVPPDVPEDCESDYRSSSSSSCEISLQCEDSWVYAYCYQDFGGTGTWGCECGSDVGYYNYQLQGVNGQTACPYTVDLCRNGVAPEFSGPLECSPNFQYSGAGYCEHGVVCTQSADLGGGVSAVANQYKYASCNSNTTGSRCQCSGGTGYFEFDLPGVSVSSDTCTDAMDICDKASTAEPDGPVSCAQTSQYAGTDYCEAQLTCTQSATVDGTVVGMRGNLTSWCEQVGTGVWSCTCTSGSDSEEFELEGTDPWATCGEASVLCPDLVDVVIGGGGGGIGMPVPGPSPIPVDVTTSSDAGP